jgi:hypothetical protein
MLKKLIVSGLIVAVVMPFSRAFGGVSRTMEFRISVTIPPHVMMNSNQIGGGSAKNQLSQTQTVFRNNQLVQVTSIVVP